MSKSITNFIFILLLLKLNLFIFVESNDDKCGKDLKLVQKFFKFLYNDDGINKEFKSILLNKYSTFLTKIANKKARKERKTKENLIEENDKNDSPKSTEASSSKLLNKEAGNNEGKNEGSKEVQTVQTFTELLNENDDDKEAEHLSGDRNKLDLEGRTGWISPESSSKANIDNYKDVEPTPEVGKRLDGVDLACEAYKAQILEELFRDIEAIPEAEHKEAELIPEAGHIPEDNNRRVDVDLTSLSSPSNEAPNHLSFPPSPPQQMPNHLLARNINNGNEATNHLSLHPSPSHQRPNYGDFYFYFLKFSVQIPYENHKIIRGNSRRPGMGI
uniref:Candidate secreted effector n=1 Tax=Meloidogyne incognita TaxID=6306 RepID=A0A914L2H0_MELIC